MKNPDFYTDYIPNQYTDQGLFTYTVIRESLPPYINWDFFICEAEDADHAEEQSLNADPDMPVLWVNEGLKFDMEDDNE